jgi:hypothetical protein
MVASEVKQIGATVDTEVRPSPLKKLYLATLGAGVVIREEGGKLFEHLVERGTPLEEPVRQHVANAREQIDRDVTLAGAAINRAVGRVLRRDSAAQASAPKESAPQDPAAQGSTAEEPAGKKSDLKE